MSSYEAKRCEKRPPTHPGSLLSDVFDSLGLTKTEIARRLGISRQHLLDILAERKPVSAQFAVRIGKFLGQNGAYGSACRPLMTCGTLNTLMISSMLCSGAPIQRDPDGEQKEQ